MKSIKLSKRQAVKLRVASAIQRSVAPHSRVRGVIYSNRGTAVSPIIQSKDR